MLRRIVSFVVNAVVTIAAVLLVIGILSFAASTIVAIIDISDQIVSPIPRPFK
jgi:hypothetical protein